jgi:ADP-heptose:LPS heptosyltransferase
MKPPADFSRVHNVLILRTDHLGDLLLSTPLIRAMRAALPGRRFTLVASPANAGALAGWDAVDEVRVYDAAWPWQQKVAFVKELRRVRWDLCLTLSPRTPSYILGWLSGAPLRAGLVYSRRVLARLLSPLWLTHTVVSAVDEKLAEGRPVPHEVEQLAEIAVALGLPEGAAAGPLEFPPEPAAAAWAQKWLADNHACGCCLVGIHGAGKWLSQGWSAADFLSLAAAVAAMRSDCRVLLTFGPGDAVLETAVEAALSKAPHPALLLPGRLSVPRWAALFSLCGAVVTPDTGSLHLAVAVGRPVVAMYESDTFLHCSAQWAPWQVPHVLVRRSSPPDTQAAVLDGLRTLLAPPRVNS